jgi:hypothetical protein
MRSVFRSANPVTITRGARHLQSFFLDEDGRLHQNPPLFRIHCSPDKPSDICQLGMRTHPNLRILYVDVTLSNEVAVYRYDEKGKLSFVRTVADLPCAGLGDAVPEGRIHYI